MKISDTMSKAASDVSPNADIKISLDENEVRRKAEYLAMLDKSLQEIHDGHFVEVSADEMRRLLNE